LLNRGKVSGNDPYKFLVASGGADGTVKIWKSSDASKKNGFECIYTLNHSHFQRRSSEGNDEEVSQVYGLEFIDNWQGVGMKDAQANCFLMTCSDDFVHLWEVEVGGTKPFQLVEVMSFRFSSYDNVNYGVTVERVTSSGLDLSSISETKSEPKTEAKAETRSEPRKASEAEPETTQTAGAFGGDRNPENLIYVFDASYCETNGLLGTALADGTVRLVNGRGICVSILSLPGCQSHLTSFAWDAAGTRLASCVATGHLVMWELDYGDHRGFVMPSCAAVLEGGHDWGRPLYGAKFCGGSQEVRICLGGC